MAATYVIYHNPRCRKSREGLKILQEAGVEPEIVEYLEDPPGQKKIGEILAKTGLDPQDLVRKKEKEYKLAGLTKESTRAEVVRAIATYPKLLERPVVVRGKKAVLGRPPEKIRDLL